MDVLSSLLGTLRLRGTLYFSTEFTRPWGLRVPKLKSVARFHLVARGGCWVRVIDDDHLVHLEAGDLILIPHGSEHVLSDTPDTPCRTVDEVVRESGFTGHGALVHGGRTDTGAPTKMLCGHFEFDEMVEHPFLFQLPHAIVIRWDEYTRGSPLQDMFRFMVREVSEAKPGNEAVVARLSEVLFVQAVRWWAERERHNAGVLAAMADPNLGRALAALHADPAARWTVESLGREAAMSRTSFAQSFRAAMGTTPLRYLTAWRVQIAKRLLAESEASLERVALRVGYESAASFSKIFKKQAGTTPGAYRRQAQATDGSTHI